MKKIFILTIALSFATIQLMAQKEYKFEKTGGKLILNNISWLNVEGYNGKEVILTVTDPKQNNGEEQTEDPRAKGLSALNNAGFDNTGLGFAVNTKGNETVVSAIGSLGNKTLKIKLPNSVALSLRNDAWPVTLSDKYTIELKDVKSEIDISIQYENCKLTNVSGPLSIKTLSGNVEVAFAKEMKSPVSIYSVRGYIDVTVNDQVKADLSLNSMSGKIYADKSLNLEANVPNKRTPDVTEIKVDKIVVGGKATTISQVSNDSTTRSLVSRITTGTSLNYSGAGSFNGTLNGGGGKMLLQSSAGNIYLRK